MRKRRRSVRWERGRGRRTVLFLAALLLCGVVAFLWLRSTDVFAVRHITATGTDQITEEQLAPMVSDALGENLLSLSTGEIKEALLALPYVESVQVIRSFPDTLEIKVSEYRPVARLQSPEGKTWLVSDSGTVLEDHDPGFLPDLPLVVPTTPLTVAAGDLLPESVSAILPLAQTLQAGAVAQELPAVAKIAVSAAGCATLVLKDGGELRLGTADGLDQKLEIAADVLKKCLDQGRLVEYVDASVVDRVAVKGR